MNPDRPGIDDLFAQVLEAAPDERAPMIAALSGGDEALASELRALLASDGDAGSQPFWNGSALEHEARRAAREPESPHQTIGAWRVLGVIGSGGMGAVYLAARDDQEYQKRVAIKLIRRGMDSDAIIRRFRNERQILAGLEHPNIARLIDGGTTLDGLPYLVMEHVDGKPLDAYAAEHGLSIAERVRLFCTVCAAVQYAHQNLVVHRDLKPGNILVTPDGVPKLLDFGIAKLLSPDVSPEAADATTMHLMTPEYASPEQVRGEPITTVSDIYSLGVLLYRLLTGRPPYRVQAGRPDELARVICTEDPLKPSTALRLASQSEEAAAWPAPDVARVRQQLRGDLDAIILMALRKEPARRYASVAEFADDLRRSQEGLPVAAHRGTLGYRAGKFLRRHYLTAGAAAVVLVSLMGGMLATLREAQVARAERARAERRFAQVRRAATSFLFDFHDSLQNVPGTLATRQMVVQRALAWLDDLVQEGGNDRQLRSELATAYQRVGTLAFDTPTSLRAQRQALAIGESLVHEEPGNTGYRMQLADMAGSLGDRLREAGDSAGATHYYQTDVALMEELHRREPRNPDFRLHLADAYTVLGTTLIRTGNLALALDYEYKGLSIAKELSAEQPLNTEYRRALHRNTGYVATVLRASGDYASATRYRREALGIAESLLASDPDSATYKRDVWAQRTGLGDTLEMDGDLAGAITLDRLAVQGMEDLSRADPGDLGHRHWLAMSYLQLARALAASGRVREALPLDERATGIAEELLKRDPSKSEAVSDVAMTRAQTASALLSAGEVARAAEYAARSRALYDKLAGHDPGDVTFARGRAEAYRIGGDVEAKAAHWRAARELYGSSLRMWTALHSQGVLAKPDAQKPELLAHDAARCELPCAERGFRHCPGGVAHASFQTVLKK